MERDERVGDPLVIEFSASVSGAFILAGGLGTGVSFIGFRHFPDTS